MSDAQNAPSKLENEPKKLVRSNVGNTLTENTGLRRFRVISKTIACAFSPRRRGVKVDRVTDGFADRARAEKVAYAGLEESPLRSISIGGKKVPRQVWQGLQVSISKIARHVGALLERAQGAKGMMTVKQRSHEEWLTELNDAVRRYRAGLADSRAHDKLTYDEAVATIRKLGFTAGEAVRLLRSAAVNAGRRPSGIELAAFPSAIRRPVAPRNKGSRIHR